MGQSQTEIIEKQLAKQIKADLWKQGELGFIALPHQVALYNAVRKFVDADPNQAGLKYVVDCARRFGKTFILLLVAVEFCMRNPGSHVRFAAPSKTQLKKIIHPSMNKILAQGVDFHRPKWKSADSCYVFPNGSHLHLAGCDDTESMEALRGTESHLNIVTEGGSIARLKYLLSDILIPQTLTTKGKTFVDSTPPPDPHHYYNLLVDEAKKKGNYIRFTIMDNTSLDKDTVETFIEEAGGRENPTCKREYFCERARDEENALLPEFDAEFHVKPFDVPEDFEYYDRYMALDLGLVDKSVNIYAYYDHINGVLMIQDEITCQGKSMTSDDLGRIINEKRKELWGDLPIYREIADNNNQQALNDLNQKFTRRFLPTRKSTLQAMVNNLRNLFKARRIIIHPRCVEIAGCCDSGVWDKRRTAFARHPVWGHFDGLAALVYLALNLDQNRNPTPASEMDVARNFYLQAPKGAMNEAIESLKERFAWKR